MLSLPFRAILHIRSSMARSAIVEAQRHFYIEDEAWDSSFVMPLDSPSRAYVGYLQRGNTYDLVHSSIPAVFKGFGYEDILAEKTLDFIVQKNAKFTIKCDSIKKYYLKHEAKYKKNYEQ